MSATKRYVPSNIHLSNEEIDILIALSQGKNYVYPGPTIPELNEIETLINCCQNSDLVSLNYLAIDQSGVTEGINSPVIGFNRYYVEKQVSASLILLEHLNNVLSEYLSSFNTNSENVGSGFFYNNPVHIQKRNEYKESTNKSLSGEQITGVIILCFAVLFTFLLPWSFSETANKYRTQNQFVANIVVGLVCCSGVPTILGLYCLSLKKTIKGYDLWEDKNLKGFLKYKNYESLSWYNNSNEVETFKETLIERMSNLQICKKCGKIVSPFCSKALPTNKNITVSDMLDLLGVKKYNKKNT